MKNLTHYFKSPKEDSIDNTVKAGAPDEIIQEKAPSKKRKLSLSKSKKKKNLSPEEKKLSPENARCTHEEQSKTEYSTKKLSGKRNKRKREDDSNTLHKKIKTTKSSINLKKSDESGQEVNSETTTCKSSVEPIKNATTETKENVNTVDESSLSCDEPLAKTKNRKLKKNLFEDSDENEADSSPAAEQVENNDSTHSIISRNSLFSYFNKVDKEIAFQKERKSEKLQVKAIVHSSPSGTKVERQSTDKISFQNKTKAKRRKNKLELDDSDSIEIISSEEIVDENSSINVNVPVEAEENQKSLSSPNLPNKPMSSNLASIFITRKSGLQTKNVENVSSPKLIEEAPSVNETVNAHCRKETKPNKQTKALSRSKKSGKKKKDLQNKNTSIGDGDCEDKISSKTGPQQEGENNSSIVKNSVSNIDDSRNTSSNIRKDLKDKLNSPSIESPADKNNLPITESPKVVKSTKNPNLNNGKTPEKSNINNKVKNNIDSEKTPKNKGPTINGYFTPKNKCSNNANVASMEKSTKKSPWVMKVCLNSASKNVMVDSDEGDFVESQDSGKGESEPVTILQEEFSKIEDSDIEVNDSNHSVVVIDDDENPTIEVDIREDDGKRRSLPRNAKKPTPNILEEKEEEVKDTKSQTPKQPVKMWPFFQKGGARQAKEAPVDEAKLKAKMLFLESGVPESIKRKVETVKSDTTLGNPAPFPTVSHVVQADVPATGGGSDPISCSLPRVRSTSPPPAVPAWTTMLPTGPPEESEIPVFERPGNVKAFLEKLKEEEPKTEVKVLYKKLKEYKNKAESDIWTEVYKPTNSADMVGNSENIKKLKTWLETLKNCRKREGSVSSGDEFVNDDSDGDDNSFNNMAVICGPCGCGKTSAVYAIARELDIKVLEINASCNRSGKRILAEFSESTQSHHVERSQSINGLFNNQSSGKKKRKKLKNSDKSKSEKTSLILVEDADLLFADCDDGFVPALASLAASSKRPIILVTNQDHTPHLDRFNNSKLLQISFNRPRPNKLSLWLRLVGLVEGVMMPPDLALRLVTARKCDVRRCLLDLQLMVHSNNSEVKDSSSVCRLWWEWPSGYQLRYELPTLLEPEEEEVEDATEEVDRSVALARLRRVADTTRRLAALDVLARGSDDGSEVCREECEDPCPVAWTSRWKDSTALTPPATSHRALGHEAMWLQQALGVGHEHRAGQTPQEARWLSILRQGEQLFTAGVATTVHTNHPAVTCDYLPALRQLGRAEQVRLANYTRRANRFFNYLQGLGIHASKSYRDFMCDAFS